PPPRPPTSSLFPYTTLFRSCRLCPAARQTLASSVACRRFFDAVAPQEWWVPLKTGPPGTRAGGLLPASEWLGVPVLSCFWDRSRSEEHTSELQSRENLVCRL